MWRSQHELCRPSPLPEPGQVLQFHSMDWLPLLYPSPAAAHTWCAKVLQSNIHILNILCSFSRPELRHHPWHAAETIFSTIWAFFFFVASCVVLSKSKDILVRGVGDHGSFVSAGFFGLLATGLYTLQVAQNYQIDLFLFRLTFLGTCGAAGVVTRWIGGMVSHLPSMTQVFS